MPFIVNPLKGYRELISAVAAQGPEYFTCDALRVNSDQRPFLGGGISHHQRDDAFGAVFGLESEYPEVAVFARQ